MNKILKCAFGLLTLITLNIACFSNAQVTPDFILPSQKATITSSSITSSNYNTTILNGPLVTGSGYAICISPIAYHTNSTDLGFFSCSTNIGASSNLYNIDSCNLLFEFGDSSSSNYDIVDSNMNCYYIDSTNKNFGIARKTTGNTSQLRYSHTFINYDSLKSYFNSGYIKETEIDSQYCISNNLCPGNVLMTQNQCESIYNLIPESSITANYCRLNFDLIDPQECPINEGTGAIVRSNLMINNTPYAQNQNINMFIPDFLQWNIAFNDLNTTIEIEGYNANEEYIENVINQEKLTPTPEDLTYLIQGTANFIPYLFIGLLIIFAVKIFGKIWK